MFPLGPSKRCYKKVQKVMWLGIMRVWEAWSYTCSTRWKYMFYLSALTIQIIQMKVNKHMDGMGMRKKTRKFNIYSLIYSQNSQFRKEMLFWKPITFGIHVNFQLSSAFSRFSAYSESSPVSKPILGPKSPALCATDPFCSCIGRRLFPGRRTLKSSGPQRCGRRQHVE